MKYEPIIKQFPHMIHGGDYNPDQWRDEAGIWDEDFRLMQLAGMNSMSIGIFSWTALEPEEGVYDFSWMDEIMDRLAAQGAYAVLATPSGARPAWLAAKYPEVLRVNGDRSKQIFGERHNHCFTSPVYREKTAKINRLLAERYKDHPALGVWHISNEYGGDCHCELCQEAFRSWLKARYDNDLKKLNKAWWTGFWSHIFTDWSQIQSPSSHGDSTLHGLNLDWKRFVTDQTIDFYKQEIVPLREITPEVPITTNLMGTYPGLDYWKFAKELDVVSWDNYPTWHTRESEASLASDISFVHDINRALKGGKPFMLMESTPSMTNWQPVSKLKRPNMHRLSSLQAVAHGSDTVQYFQWRKSRGASEKFHGAVVDHVGHEHTRVFGDVARLGSDLKKMDAVIGTTVRPDVAVVFDWDNRWALEDALGLHKTHKDYEQTCKKHYEAFWKAGVPVDVIEMNCDFSGYKLLVAPMLYMVKPGVGERIEAFVKAGGTFVATYCSGFVDETDLCFLGGFPGPLKDVLGIWDEETDSLTDEDVNYVKDAVSGKRYEVRHICDLIHVQTAKVLATYDSDFYAGTPALTCNDFGDGKAYFIAFRNNKDFEEDFYNGLIEELGLKKALETQLPEGVTAQLRTDEEKDFVFVMNFSDEVKTVTLPADRAFEDLITGEAVADAVELEAFGCVVLVGESR